MKVLIDTCVILDNIQHREPFADTSSKALFTATSNNNLGFISASAFTDIFFLSYKSLRKAEVEEPLKKALSLIRLLLENLSILTVDEGICRKALYGDIEDIEDAVQINAAIKGNIDCIITRNLKDFDKSPIPVYSPEDFIKLIESENHQAA